MEKYLIYDFKSGYGREPIIRKTKMERCFAFAYLVVTGNQKMLM